MLGTFIVLILITLIVTFTVLHKKRGDRMNETYFNWSLFCGLLLFIFGIGTLSNWIDSVYLVQDRYEIVQTLETLGNEDCVDGNLTREIVQFNRALGRHQNVHYEFFPLSVSRSAMELEPIQTFK